MTLADILGLFSAQLNDVEGDLCKSLDSDIEPVNRLIGGTINSGGKRIRPLFLILTAGLCGYSGELVTKISTIIEYMHTASLLHDDVIDGAASRRGKPSANALYGNSVTILSGDYLYTKAFLKVLDFPGKEYSRVLIKAAAAMSEGEVFQLLKTGDLNLTMDEYMRIIHGKTAALFSATCECGALLGDQPDKIREELANFGLNVGYAFQLKDDVLDYFGNERIIGKKPGTDFHEKKTTLPVLLLMKETGSSDRKAIEELFFSESDECERLNRFMQMLGKYDIKKKADAVIKERIDCAIASLDLFPSSSYKDALHTLLLELNHRNS